MEPASSPKLSVLYGATRGPRNPRSAPRRSSFHPMPETSSRLFHVSHVHNLVDRSRSMPAQVVKCCNSSSWLSLAKTGVDLSKTRVRGRLDVERAGWPRSGFWKDVIASSDGRRRTASTLRSRGCHARRVPSLLLRSRKSWAADRRQVVATSTAGLDSERPCRGSPVGAVDMSTPVTFGHVFLGLLPHRAHGHPSTQDAMRWPLSPVGRGVHSLSYPS